MTAVGMLVTVVGYGAVVTAVVVAVVRVVRTVADIRSQPAVRAEADPRGFFEQVLTVGSLAGKALASLQWWFLLWLIGIGLIVWGGHLRS